MKRLRTSRLERTIAGALALSLCIALLFGALPSRLFAGDAGESNSEGGPGEGTGGEGPGGATGDFSGWSGWSGWNTGPDDRDTPGVEGDRADVANQQDRTDDADFKGDKDTSDFDVDAYNAGFEGIRGPSDPDAKDEEAAVEVSERKTQDVPLDPTIEEEAKAEAQARAAEERAPEEKSFLGNLWAWFTNNVWNPDDPDDPGGFKKSASKTMVTLISFAVPGPWSFVAAAVLTHVFDWMQSNADENTSSSPATSGSQGAEGEEESATGPASQTETTWSDGAAYSSIADGWNDAPSEPGQAVVAAAGETCLFTVDKPVIERGEEIQAQWFCGAQGETQGIGFASGGAQAGTLTGKPAETATLGIVCSNRCQSTATVQVDHPYLEIQATPNPVRAGQTTTISWQGSKVAACSVGGPNFSQSGIQGTAATPPIEFESTYTLTCTTKLGSVGEEEVTVRLVPSFENL